ncbi:MAG: pyrimidine 5'-nucleotidase [Anaerolineaceae bacterium]|nr:pyrimidine 5'-nucleotidase [Anaerolineaceae bacterium]
MKNMEVEIIIFDLDDTLYPSSSGVWTLIRERIDLFMISKLNYTVHNVHSAREQFFKEFGTTLRGLESVHHIDPMEYLQFVHNIPIHRLLFPNIILSRILSEIKQRKVIFTNGDRWHAKRVTDSLNITENFDEVIDILDVSPYCKPMKESFEIAFRKLNIFDPQKALLIDDSLRNIQAAKNLGLQTIWVKEVDNHDHRDFSHIRSIEELIIGFPAIFQHEEK